MEDADAVDEESRACFSMMRLCADDQIDRGVNGRDYYETVEGHFGHFMALAFLFSLGGGKISHIFLPQRVFVGTI